MLNTSVHHITELENAIIAASNWLKMSLTSEEKEAGKRLEDAAESFGLDLSDKDDPFGTGDI